jgi:hypothetical protein
VGRGTLHDIEGSVLKSKFVDTLWLPLVAFLVVAVFCLHIAMLLFLARLYIPLNFGIEAQGEPGSDRFEIIDHDISSYLRSGPSSSIRADQASEAEIARSRPIVIAESVRYGESTIRDFGPRLVILCRNLTVEGHEVGGVTLEPSRTILLNVRGIQPDREEAFRWAIHHEFFHMFDHFLERKAGSRAQWTRLNPEGFAYGGDEILRALERTNESPGQRPDTAGFLTYYSMVSIAEDRADVFAHMMTSSDESKVIAAEDAIIGRKMALLKRDLSGVSRDFDSILKDRGPAR